MYPLIDSELIHLRQQELLREAEREHVAAALAQPGRWRARVGAALIRLGAHLGGDPRSVSAGRRAPRAA